MLKNRTMPMTACWIVTNLLLATNVTRAELSSDHYRDLQQAAAEQWQVDVEWTVVTRQTIEGGANCHVRAYCHVVDVERSRCGFDFRGHHVFIEYDTEERNIPIVGPSPVPIPRVGDRYRVFVKPNFREQHFEPAAEGRSFLWLSEGQ